MHISSVALRNEISRSIVDIPEGVSNLPMGNCLTLKTNISKKKFLLKNKGIIPLALWVNKIY